jgi:histidinol-phosphate aminotransferase
MLQPEPHISKIALPVHGGSSFASIDNGRKLLDFSTCCNPYPPPASVRRAVESCDLNHYPDPESLQFISALSRKYGIDRSNIIAGSGSTEVLRLAALAYLNPGATAVISTPAYSEYELACSIVNAQVIKYALAEKTGFRLVAQDFIRQLLPLSPRAIFICNPNNPSGQYLSHHEIESIILAFPSTLVVLDEAYIAFTSNAWQSDALLDHGNVLIVHSLTKDFTLAGLRLGYGIASPPIIQALQKVRPPWNVSAPAQQAGVAALSCDRYLESSCRKIEACKQYLIRSLGGLGYSVLDTRTNFFLVRTGNAAAFKQKLLKKDILVRDCTSFGLPAFIRIAPRSMPDCRKLVQAIKEIKGTEI